MKIKNIYKVFLFNNGFFLTFFDHLRRNDTSKRRRPLGNENVGSDYNTLLLFIETSFSCHLSQYIIFLFSVSVCVFIVVFILLSVLMLQQCAFFKRNSWFFLVKINHFIFDVTGRRTRCTFVKGSFFLKENIVCRNKTYNFIFDVTGWRTRCISVKDSFFLKKIESVETTTDNFFWCYRWSNALYFYRRLTFL